MIELYYPGIKVREDNWLKYSLLTKRELYTIKPMQYANLDYGYLNDRLGQEFLKPYNPTNLIKRYDSSGASLMETLFENEFDFLDRNDLFKEIFDINNVLSGIIKSKLGRTTIMIGVGYFLSLYKPAFLMSEALESIASSTIDIYASRHIPIRIREGNSAMRIITSLNDI